jgi:hypothetical protein
MADDRTPTYGDGFSGDTPHLIECINALLALDEAGALTPRRLPGHARTLLVAASARLAAASLADTGEVK